MTALAYHIVIRLEDGRVLLRSVEDRRIFATVVHRIGDNFNLLSAGAADTHAHMTAACDRSAAGALAHRVECSLRWRLHLDVAFAPARVRPIDDQHHLHNSFFYGLRQQQRHDVEVDPFHEADSLPDLVGLRLLETSLCKRVATYLPRVKVRQLRDMLGCPDGEPLLRVECLGDAAAAAFGLTHFTEGSRCAMTWRARIAAVHAAPELGTLSLARALRCSRRSVERARTAPRDPAAYSAVLGQWRLRSAWLASQAPSSQRISDLLATTQRSIVTWDDTG